VGSRQIVVGNRIALGRTWHPSEKLKKCFIRSTNKKSQERVASGILTCPTI
jgi:hypothetical protein